MNKTLYKLFLIEIKYIPFIIAVLYFIGISFGCFGIELKYVALFAQLSIVTSIILLTASFTFKCCIWHRLPIYYCWIIDLISYIDYEVIIPIDNRAYLIYVILISVIFIILGMYFKNRHNKLKMSNE